MGSRGTGTSAALCVALGRAIRDERQRLQWSQETLAENAGLSRAYVTDLENGKRTPNLATLMRLATAFGMKTSKLMAAGEGCLSKSPRVPRA